jgi:hypothetical protein
MHEQELMAEAPETLQRLAAEGPSGRSRSRWGQRERLASCACCGGDGLVW